MKVKKVTANNRKKVFEIETSRGVYEYPYSRLSLKPIENNAIEKVFPDAEVAKDGFTYRLSSGDEDTIMMDQVLEYAKDPEYRREMLLFKLTVKANDQIEQGGVSKREIIRRMGTTPTQFYRLMDQTNTHKSIDQMVKLLAAMDCSVNVTFSDEVA